MSLIKRIFTALTLSALAASSAFAQKAIYAPTPPGILSAEPVKAKTSAPVAAAATQFSVGDPTDEEQMHLELINRARVDATAEAERLIRLSQIDKDVGDQFRVWSVDTNLMKAQFATNPPAAPLSFNAKLIQSARGHSQFQFDNAVQTHIGSGGSTLSNRVNAVGYLWANVGENVFTDAISVEHGHAGFDVDWGPGPGGMQSPPGHRNSIHARIFNEIGIGVVKGFNTVNGNTVGPQVITEDFGRSQAATTYITGVAYYDINGNDFYDLGEGLPGVTVTVDGVSTFAITSTSGAYSIPVPPNRSYTVRFNATGLAEVTKTATVASDNVKVDFKPAYVAPAVISGPTTAYVGIDNIYQLAPLPTATGYRARASKVTDVPIQNAEGALDDLTITTFGGYPVVSTTVKASGAGSFHLGQMVDNGGLDPQIVELNDHIYVFAGARIDFKSKMAVAGTGQFASLEISENEGESWTTLWTQSGVGPTEEPAFSAKSVSLGAYEGKTIRARFVFDVNGSAYVLPDPSSPSFDHVGWYFDDVEFVNAKSFLSAEESGVFIQPRFAFNPSATGDYLLQFQPINGARTFSYTPAIEVTVQAAPSSVSISNNVTATPAIFTMQFTATATALFSIESAASINGPWAPDTTAVVTGPVQGVFTVTIPRNGPVRFYRVAATF
jgi:hypothetical protein